MNDIVYERPYDWYYPSMFIHRIVSTIFGIIGFMLTVRFVLILLNANAGAPFVAWVYNVTNEVVAPFAGAFPSLYFGGFVFDLTTVFAMIGYSIIGWLIIRLLDFVFLSPRFLGGNSQHPHMPLRG